MIPLNESVKPFGFKRNIEYVKVNFYLMFKTLKEYKINTFGALIDQIAFLVIFFLFFTVLYVNFGNDIGWSHLDFLLYMMVLDIILVSQGLTYWGKNLKRDVLDGELIIYLKNPLTPFFSYEFANISTYAGLMLAIDAMIFPILLFVAHIPLYTIALGMILLLLLCGSFIVFKMFLRSTVFISFALADVGFELEQRLFRTLQTFPSPFFSNSILWNLFLVYPLFFAGSLLVPIFTQKPVPYLEIQIYTLIIVLIVSSIGTYINWKYGLKRYEAYG